MAFHSRSPLKHTTQNPYDTVVSHQPQPPPPQQPLSGSYGGEAYFYHKRKRDDNQDYYPHYGYPDSEHRYRESVAPSLNVSQKDPSYHIPPSHSYVFITIPFRFQIPGSAPLRHRYRHHYCHRYPRLLTATTVHKISSGTTIINRTFLQSDRDRRILTIIINFITGKNTKIGENIIARVETNITQPFTSLSSPSKNAVANMAPPKMLTCNRNSLPWTTMTISAIVHTIKIAITLQLLSSLHRCQ